MLRNRYGLCENVVTSASAFIRRYSHLLAVEGVVDTEPEYFPGNGRKFDSRRRDVWLIVLPTQTGSELYLQSLVRTGNALLSLDIRPSLRTRHLLSCVSHHGKNKLISRHEGFCCIIAHHY